MPTALSPQNPRVVRARALLDAGGRREQRRFLIEGPTLLDEARASGLRFESVFVTADGADRSAAAIRDLESDATSVYLIPAAALARLSDVATPSGIVAVVELPGTTTGDVFARPGPVLLLAGINDPGNAGTLIRSAEAFGAAGVLVGCGGADPFAPKVVRAAMGSLFRLPVAVVTAAEALDAAHAAGRAVVAADMTGTPLATTHVPRDAVIAVGNERHGVAAFLPRWDAAVRIEHAGPAESLNAAVAGSVILYSVSRAT